MDHLIGAALGDYRVELEIGNGATGVVYRARNQRTQRLVAMKVLHENLGSISGLERRFSREARVLNKLSHPNIVEIVDFGVTQGRTFIAMELLEGITLEQSLERGPLEPAKAIEIYDPILFAVAEAHVHEVVHRDLKPANVFLTTDGNVKVLDFGLAKMLSIEEQNQEGTLTRKGRIVGTPAYMAPEQITGVFVDVSADVYALGVMLYELLADRRPFLYERRSELLRAHLLEPVPTITSVRAGLWVHPALEALLARALAKDPNNRYPNARAMLDALRALPPGSARLVDQLERSGERTRVASTSAVISDSERQAITQEAGISTAEPMRAVAPQRDRPTEPVPSAAPRAGVSTWVLFGIALTMLAISIGLWFTLAAR